MKRLSQSAPLVSAVALLVIAAPALLAETLLIHGGTVHAVSQEPRRADVLIVDGVIRDVDTALEATAGAARLDATGLEVYPGLFDAMTQLGLTEIGSIAATVDTTELGDANPQLIAASGIHPASEILPVTRANGITHAISAPSGGDSGLFPGQASAIELNGWTVEEMLIEASVGVVLQWPPLRLRTFDPATRSADSVPFRQALEKTEEAIQGIRDWLDAARHYRQAQESGSERLERDLKLEALVPVIAGHKPFLVVADEERAIRQALELKTEQGFDMILVGGRDAYKVKEALAKADVPVILGQTQALPAEADDPYDQPFRAPSELYDAGVRFAFSTRSASDSRTLPYQAATAVGYGLPEEEALRALTLTPAEIFGLDDQLGSIEVGKRANLIVTDGDPLEIRTEIRAVVIGGHSVSLDNRHLELYDRYRQRPAAGSE